jgi:hypothetical protein
MCVSFLKLAARMKTGAERDAYLATANKLSMATSTVRSHLDVDVDAEDAFPIDVKYRDKIRELLDERARTGEFKFEFEARFRARQAKVRTKKCPRGVRAAVCSDYILCPDRDTAISIADRLGIYDLPKPPTCHSCAKSVTCGNNPELDDDYEHNPLFSSPYVRSLKHGFWQISLQDIPHTIAYDTADDDKGDKRRQQVDKKSTKGDDTYDKYIEYEEVLSCD